MTARRSISMLATHLAARRRIADARRAVQAKGHVANVLLEIERELARTDAKILEIEELISRLADDHVSTTEHVRILWFKVRVVVNDKRQLRELVASLRKWRDLMAGDEARRALAAARAFATHLVGGAPEEESPIGRQGDIDDPPARATDGVASSAGRWG